LSSLLSILDHQILKLILRWEILKRYNAAQKMLPNFKTTLALKNASQLK